VPVSCECGFVLVWWRCDKLCSSGLVDDFIYTHIGAYGALDASVGCNSQWRGERYDATSTRTGPLQSKKIKNRIER